jgi:type I restriction enzyme M protein
MRMLVHYHVYGDAAKVPGLVAKHSERIRKQIDLREEDEVGRLEAEYQGYADKLAALDCEIAAARANRVGAKTKGDATAAKSTIAKLEKPRERLVAKLAERDEQIAEARRRAKDDRNDVAKVADDLVALYADRDELLKHARVVDLEEIAENEFNLNIPRYVDTFEPEPSVGIKDALKAMREAAASQAAAEVTLLSLLQQAGFDA